MVRVRLPLLLAVLCGCLLTRGLNAEEADTRRAIQRLIDVGWSTSPSARAAVDTAFTEETAAIAGDQRALKAWTLILLHQRRYDEASRRLDQWLARDSNNWFALRARIWLWTILKNYPAAMLSAEKLAEQIAAADGKSMDVDEELSELTTYLGRIYGYLAGPVAGTVNQDERRLSERKVLSRLGDQRAELFSKSRDRVLQQHLELSDTRSDELEKARDREAAEREKTLAEVAAEREQMQTRAGEIKEQRAKLREEMQSEVSELEKQERPLALQYSQLDARATGVNRELRSLTLQIDRLEFDASREEDPVLRNRLLRDADRLRILATRLDGELVALQRQAAGIEQQRAILAGKLREVQNNYGGQIAGLDREMAAFAKREKRLAADEARAKKPIRATTGQVLSLGAQAAALTTYDTLPLESAKEAVLAEIK